MPPKNSTPKEVGLVIRTGHQEDFQKIRNIVCGIDMHQSMLVACGNSTEHQQNTN